MWLVCVCSFLALSSAHRGLLSRPSCNSDFGTSALALPIPDATISWAFQHYLDCTHRAVWSKFVNPSPGFKFYVGVGSPPVSRQSLLRADAVIIGPDLPELSGEDLAYLPQEIRNDPALLTKRGVLYRSPKDQSTCAHLGEMMTEASTIRNGRCDFYEPYGATHSWRILDANDIEIPVAGETYYVAVFLQENTSGKVGIAVGTWKEDFWTPMPTFNPSCPRDMSDFSEKYGDLTKEFPVQRCDAVRDRYPTATPTSAHLSASSCSVKTDQDAQLCSTYASHCDVGQRYNPWMLQNCDRSCCIRKFKASSDCGSKSDRNAQLCRAYANHCQVDQKYHAWMTLNCEKTCCNFPAQPTCASLIDSAPASMCSTYKGHCQDGQLYYAWMQINCANTCCLFSV